MTFVGLGLIVIGFIGLLAGLISLALARYGGQIVRRYSAIGLGRAAVLASAAAPLMVLGFIISDARRMVDLLGMALLAVSLVAVVVVFCLPVVAKVRGNGSTIRAIVSGAAAVLSIGSFIGVAIMVGGDLQSLLILFGFIFLLVGFLVAFIGLFWLVVQLIRRRGRVAAAAFVWSAVSLTVFGLVGIAILAPRPPSVPDSMATEAELDQFLEDLVSSGSPPGVSLVVVKDGETVYNKGFGLADGPNGIPVTPDTVYHWYSVTKIVTAIAIMQLVERGLIDLDDPVSDYLAFFNPDYPSASSEPVTVVNLLNHSAGIPDNLPAGFSWLHFEGEEAFDQTQLLRDKIARYDTLAFEPGSKAIYTNVGYMILGALIEQVTGLSYEQYVVDNVLDPLGMVNTGFKYTEAMRANEGVGMHPLADFQTPILPTIRPPWPFDLIRDYADGQVWFNRFFFDSTPPSGLIGPAPEMARFLAAILNGGEFEGARILSQESVETMLNERHAEAGKGGQSAAYTRIFDEFVQGMGWKVVRDGGRLHLSHGGGGAGFSTLMRLYPDEDLGIVILVNGTNVEHQDIANAIAEIEW